MLKKLLLRSALAASLTVAVTAAVVPLTAFAQEAPDAIVRKNTNEILAAIKADKDLVAGNQKKIEKLADEKVLRYIVQMIQATRENYDIMLGGSPRASIAMYRASQALAAIRGNAFVLPDDVKRVAPAVLGHRIIVRPESRLRKVTANKLVDEILGAVSVPTMKGGAEPL